MNDFEQQLRQLQASPPTTSEAELMYQCGWRAATQKLNIEKTPAALHAQRTRWLAFSGGIASGVAATLLTVAVLWPRNWVPTNAPNTVADGTGQDAKQADLDPSLALAAQLRIENGVEPDFVATGSIASELSTSHKSNPFRPNLGVLARFTDRRSSPINESARDEYGLSGLQRDALSTISRWNLKATLNMPSRTPGSLAPPTASELTKQPDASARSPLQQSPTVRELMFGEQGRDLF